MYKNNNVDLHFYRHRWSFICREWFSAGTHVHFAEVPYTLVLGKEVKWDSEITTTWWTFGNGNVFDCLKRHQKWHFWYINNCRENTMRKKSNVCFGSPLQVVTISNFPSGAHTFECTGVTLADTGSGRWKCWQLTGPSIRKKWIVIT